MSGGRGCKAWVRATHGGQGVGKLGSEVSLGERGGGGPEETVKC